MDQKERLARQLEHVNTLHQRRKRSLKLDPMLKQLKVYEQTRLLETYQDFRTKGQYTSAIDFMAQDIFGSDFSERDAQMLKAYPALIKLLPGPILEAVAVAVELNVHLVTYEDTLLPLLRLDEENKISEQAYCEAFLQGGCSSIRKTLVEHVYTVGQGLDRIVGKPFIATTLKLCRGPANLAGLSLLQDFLERGYQAFKKMKGANAFMHAFQEREFQIIDNVVDQRPKPFNLDI